MVSHVSLKVDRRQCRNISYSLYAYAFVTTAHLGGFPWPPGLSNQSIPMKYLHLNESSIPASVTFQRISD